jgi:DNA repair protein RecN (Recombination protein N)
MIKHLILNNLVLVDSCEIHFGPAFNAVTGETGAGKTALIEAIGLALGERADTSLVRKGADKAYVEICFDIGQLPHIREMLDEAGLLADDSDDLVIRREISKQGKNRAFVNCRTAPLPLLQKIGAELIDMIGQHAHHALRTGDSQRALVDLFGNHRDMLKEFQAAFAQEKETLKKWEELQQLSAHRDRDLDTWRYQLEEIESVSLKKGEEEESFEKYQKLAHAQELSEKIGIISQALSESPSAILPQLSKCIKNIDSLLTFDKSLTDASSLLHEAHIALTETHRAVQSYSQNIDTDPKAFQRLEDRLSAINKLKRKYGQTFDEIAAYHQKIKSELDRLENLSDELESAKTAFKEAKSKTDEKAKLLTSKRTASALKLQKLLTAQLQHLNMNGAELTIQVAEVPRSSFGDNAIEFWLKANTGEHPGLVKEHSSGGELSRLLFAIKIALAEKNNTPTLIFDEIDANVGGKTATIIGEKLQELGKCRQVVCITHFPQVASKADEHFGVQKVESEGRTLTEIKQLSKKQREQELLRMIGGKKLDLASL